MLIKLFLLLSTLSIVLSSPAKNNREVDGKVLYDQRQEGEWNVRADLQNFVILVIPTQTQTSSPSPVAGGSLLDFLSKTVPKRSHLKRLHNQKKNNIDNNNSQETQHFIESKTAPYHVDISRTRSQLANLHPRPIDAEQIVVAKSPAIALLKEEARGARAFVFTVPKDEEFVLKSDRKDGKIKKNSPKSILKLLGAENEQCGPGLERDAEGICRIVKQ